MMTHSLNSCNTRRSDRVDNRLTVWCKEAKIARLGRCWEKSGPHLNASRPDRAEGDLYVQGSKPRRVEGALYVQSTCLDVQRNLCTLKLWINSIY